MIFGSIFGNNEGFRVKLKDEQSKDPSILNAKSVAWIDQRF